MSISSADLPSFTELFGDIDQAEGQTARSVLSPAAYLVDLLQLRDSVVSQVPGSDPDGYHARRPDVAQLPLDETRTFGEVPHLEISNAVMKTLAERDLPGDVRAQLASALFPAPLPFSQEHERLALALRKLDVAPSELYRRYQQPLDGLTLARLRLGLSEAELALFTTRRDTEAGVAELWGLRDEAERTALLAGELPLVQRKLGLTLKQLKALLFQDLSDAELLAGAASSFFHNQDLAHPGQHLTLVDADPASPPALDRVRWSDGSPWGLRQQVLQPH
ncbi:MAG TPA: Tc toxin subunit A, partial [Kofleriaceae bacterium]|nr:Tc toxin subunit A [Kofleriaceae bacterium]